jgi:hypothetical protein
MSLSALVVLVFALAIAGLGAWGLVAPPALIAFVSRWQTPAGIALGAGLRLAFGVALLLAAPGSRAPLALQLLGGLSVLAAAALPLVGSARMETFVAWWTRRSDAFVRAWSAVALAFGVLLVAAVRP